MSGEKSATKHDTGKINFTGIAMIPNEVLSEIGAVLEFGANKYGTNNWKSGFDWLRVSAAVFRHIFAWLRGEDRDPESGLSHLAHAIAGLIFLIYYQAKGIGKDDRRI